MAVFARETFRTRRRERHQPEQIVAKSEEADRRLKAGENTGQLIHARKVSEATYLRLRRQCGGMKAKEVRQLKDFEQESVRLKKLLAEVELDKAMLEELAEASSWARPIEDDLRCISRIHPAHRIALFDRAVSIRAPA